MRTETVTGPPDVRESEFPFPSNGRALEVAVLGRTEVGRL
jgi:hypothetical protein